MERPASANLSGASCRMPRAIPATESWPVTSGIRTRPARSARPAAWWRHSRPSHRRPGTRTSARVFTAAAGRGPLVQTHPRPGVAQGGAGHLARLLGAGLEEFVELLRVVEEVQRPLPDGVQRLDDHLAEVLLEIAVALAAVAFLELRNGEVREPRVDVEQVRYGGLLRGGDDLRAGVRLGAPDLAPYHVGLVQKLDVASRGGRALAHLARRVV